MLLVLDIGNTNIKFGVFKGEELMTSWRVSTEAAKTADEYGMLLGDLLRTQGLTFKDIDSVIMSSVAPSLNYTIEHMCRYYLGLSPIVVDSDSNCGLKITYDHPKDLGPDRIVGSTAAFHLYGGPVILIDFGSATTFNAITADGEFLGGAIAPGIKTATESLVNVAAKLPRIELVRPEKVVCTNTKSGMQAGIIYGYTGLVEFMIKKIKETPGMENAKVVATGGLSQLVQFDGDNKLIDIVDRALALKGLKIIFDRQKTETL